MNTNLTSSLSSAAANTNDIRGIKPLVEIPNEWLWLWITLAVMLIAAGVTAWLLFRKKRVMTPAIPIIPPHLRAKQRLAEALFYLGDPNKFCTRVADTARVYLEERFQLRAPERTTEEFLVELQSSRHLTKDQKQSLGEFLQSCDLVKFARLEPTESALRQLHDAALRLVDETQFDPISAAAVITGSPPEGAVRPPLPPPLPTGPREQPEIVDRPS